jgi:predicted Zn-dependent peptidase
LRQTEKWILKNGVEVMALNAGEEEVVMVEWVFFAGNSVEKTNGVAAAANYLLKNGTKQRSAYSISEHFDFFGSYLNRNCYNETSNLTLHCLSKHLPDLLSVVAEILSESVFPEEELSLYVQNSKQRLSVNLKKCEFIAGREIDVLLYGPDHPYARYNRFEDLDALPLEEIRQFYDTHYQQGACMLFVAGKLPADTFSLLDQFIGQLPLRPAVIHQHPIVLPSLPAAGQRVQRITNDENGMQGAIRMARNFPNRHHPDWLGAAVLNTIFGGFFGSRLMKNIREEKGYTYGIYSYLQNHLEQSAWVVSTEAGREVCEATIQEVYLEMQRLGEERIDEEEMMLVRNYMLGTVLGDLDGPFQIINRWKNYLLHGLDETAFYQSVENIKSISTESLRLLAEKYLAQETFYELVVV